MPKALAENMYDKKAPKESVGWFSKLKQLVGMSTQEESAAPIPVAQPAV